MKKPPILLFAYHFPPENEIGAARPFRFYKYLSRLGYDCQVITAAPSPPSPLPNVHHVPDPFLSPGDGGPERYLDLLVRRIFGIMGLRWAWVASRYAKDLATKWPDTPPAIFATYPPIGTLWAARLLRKKLAAKWVADFRDPMTNVPGTREPLIRGLFAGWLQSNLAEQADLILANTDVAGKLWMDLYPKGKHKVHVMWNGFDPEEEIPSDPPPDSRPRIISHVGDLYFGRHPGPILESLQRLVAQGRVDEQQFQLQFVGYAEPDLFENFSGPQQPGWLKYTLERQSKAYAHQVTGQSHGLLLMQPKSSVQVPAKLFEYIRLKRPILAYVQRGSPAERLLQKSGVVHRAFYPDSSPESIDQTILEFLNLKTASGGHNQWFEDNFNAQEQARQLAGLVDSLYSGMDLKRSSYRATTFSVE